MFMNNQNNEKGSLRLEAFSDGVFGFAITLLVLDIHVPVVTEGKNLFSLLLVDWPTYLSFLIGFFTILICWINHHYMFESIYKSNSRMLLLNGFKLLVVTFTPFATALISKYINTPDQHTAVSVYAGNFALMGGIMFFVWHYAYRNNMMKEEADARELKLVYKYYLLALILSLGIFILSFVSIYLCLALSGVMFIIFLFPDSMIKWLLKSAIKNRQGR